MGGHGSAARGRLVGTSLAYFAVILDATAVNIALPSLGRSLGGGTTALQWVADAYAVPFAALLLLGGALADRLGPRAAFRAGVALFAAASAACAGAPGLATLVAARAAQGCAAALAVPASLALIRALYPEGPTRARAIGVWAGIAGVAAAAGPALAGALVTTAGWRSVFALNVPVGALALLLSRGPTPVGERPRSRRIPLAAHAAAVAALGALAFGLVEAGEGGAASLPALAGLAGGAAALPVLVSCARRARPPLLPPALTSGGPLAAATAVGFLINLGFYGQLFVLSLFLQDVRAASPSTAGLELLPQAAVVPLASFLSGRVSARAGPGRAMRAGLLLGAGGFAALVAGLEGPYPALLPGLVASGFGMALTMPAATTAAVGAVPAEQAGLAAGLVNAGRQTGGALGIALLGSLVAARPGAGSTQLALAVSALAFLAGAVTPGASRAAPGRGRS